MLTGARWIADQEKEACKPKRSSPVTRMNSHAASVCMPPSPQTGPGLLPCCALHFSDPTSSAFDGLFSLYGTNSDCAFALRTKSKVSKFPFPSFAPILNRAYLSNSPQSAPG